jgi:hypothetical protein
MKNINDIVNLAKTYKSNNYPNNIRTALTDAMLHKVCEISMQSLDISGDIAEVGVWRGSVGIIFGEIFKNKNIYLFDTFHGIPYSNELDNIHRAGDFGEKDRDPLYYSSFEEVKDMLSIYNNIEIYKGIFPSETSKFIYDKKFSLVHLDVDVYQSYKESLEFFYPRMMKDGLILFDDYNIPSCEGATKAIDEFCSLNEIEIINFDNLFYIKKS